MLKSKKLKLGLVMLLVVLLATGYSITVFALTPSGKGVTPVYLDRDTTPSANPDPSVNDLASPSGCTLKTVKINNPVVGNLDDQNPNDVEKSDPSSNFDVELYDIVDDTFSFRNANEAVLHVFVKAGRGGHLYSYYNPSNTPHYPNGVRDDTGLYSPATDSISHITFYYCDSLIETGCLEVVKTWDDKDTGASYDGTVNVRVYDSSNALVGTLDLTATNGWKDGLCNLLPGTYTFEEVTVPGWTPSYPDGRTLTVEAGATQPAAGAIGSVVNTVDTGSLKIKKEWNDLGSGLAYTDDITVNITGVDVTYSGSVTLKATENWEKELSKLLPGTYQFAEVTPNGWTPSYDPTNRTLTVEVGDTPADGAIGTITNTIDPGALEVTKVVQTGDVVGVVIPDFEISIQGPSYPDGTEPGATKVFNSSNGWKQTWENLIPGTYTVSEADPGNEWTVEVAGNSTVSPGQKSEVTVTNTYEQGGALKVTKVFVTGEGQGDLPNFVDVRVVGPSYPDGNTQRLSDGNDWTYLWANLIVGEYTITELNTGAQWIVSIYPDAKVAIRPEETTTVTITNTRRTEEEKGSLSVTKVIEFDLPDISETFTKEQKDAFIKEAMNESFDVKVTGPNGFEQTFPIKAVGPIVELFDLDYGDYTVLELLGDEEIFVSSFTLGSDNRHVDVVVRNTVKYEEPPPPLGEPLYLRKEFTEGAWDGKERDKDKLFTIVIIDEEENVVERQISVKQGTVVLELGEGTYTISEKDADGFSLVSIIDEKTNPKNKKQTLQITVTADSEHVIVITNTKSHPPTGGLSLLGLGALLGLGGLLLKKHRREDNQL